MEKISPFSSAWFCFLLFSCLSWSVAVSQITTRTTTACPGVTITYHNASTMLTQSNCAGINTALLGYWTGLTCAGFLQWDFNGPVMSVDIPFFSINTNDFATLTVNNTGTVTVTGTCILVNGNVAGPYTGLGLAGTVRMTVSSNLPFTRLRLDNTGCVSGWVAQCPLATVLEAKLENFALRTGKNGAVILNWETAHEINNDYFQVERSKDGKGWTPLGKVPGNGTRETHSTYTFTDHNAPEGLSLYRLRQYDLDGSHTLSKTITASLESEIRVWPTLTQDRFSVSGVEAASQVTVFDALGAPLTLMPATLPDAFEFDLSGFKPGMYLVRIKMKKRVKTYRIFLR